MSDTLINENHPVVAEVMKDVKEVRFAAICYRDKYVALRMAIDDLFTANPEAYETRDKIMSLAKEHYDAITETSVANEEHSLADIRSKVVNGLSTLISTSRVAHESKTKK